MADKKRRSTRPAAPRPLARAKAPAPPTDARGTPVADTHSRAPNADLLVQTQVVEQLSAAPLANGTALAEAASTVPTARVITRATIAEEPRVKTTALDALPRPTFTDAVPEASIAERAYKRWLARGCPVSDGREDWFAAQAELLAEFGRRRSPRTQSAGLSQLH